MRTRDLHYELKSLDSSVNALYWQLTHYPRDDAALREKINGDRVPEKIKKIASDLSSITQTANELTEPYYKNITKLHSDVGCLYYNIKEYQIAEEYFRHVLNRCLNKHDTTPSDHDENRRRLIRNYINLCDCYLGLNNIPTALSMMHQALNAHHHIMQRNEIETKFVLGDPNNQQFLEEVRQYYIKETAMAKDVEAPSFQFGTDVIKKNYDETQLVCDDLNGLSIITQETKVSQKKPSSQLDYLNTALQYQEMIKAYSLHINDAGTIGKMTEAFLAAIRALNNITALKKLSPEDQNTFKRTTILLHTELGNFYFRLGKTEEARRQWQAAIKQFPKNMPDPQFFSVSALCLPTAPQKLPTLLNMLQTCQEKSSGRYSSDDKLAIYALYEHEAIQIHHILQTQYGHKSQDTIYRLSRVLYNIGVDYFNSDQCCHGAEMYNAGIAYYVEENQLAVAANIDDSHRRWLVDAYLSLFDCYAYEHNQDGLFLSYQYALANFNAIQNKSQEELALYSRDVRDGINKKAFFHHYKKATALRPYYTEPDYRNALAIVKKMREDDSVDSLIDCLSSISLIKGPAIGPINAVTDQMQLRSIANAYWLLANEISKEPSLSGKKQRRYKGALSSAELAMNKLQQLTPEDHQFLSQVVSSLHVLSNKVSVPQVEVTKNTRAQPTSTSSSTNWQPGIFAVAPLTEPVKSGMNTEEEDMQFESNVKTP